MKERIRIFLLTTGIVLLPISIGLVGWCPAPSNTEILQMRGKSAYYAIIKTGYYRPLSFWVFGYSIVALFGARNLKEKQ
jgi:hypothetical protein